MDSRQKHAGMTRQRTTPKSPILSRSQILKSDFIRPIRLIHEPPFHPPLQRGERGGSLQNLLNRVLLNLPRVRENDHLANQALPPSFRASEASRGICRRMDSSNLQTGELKDRFFVRFLTQQKTLGSE
jgi:hypothetical protein